MNKKYYTDALSDETLAEMIDKTLKFEKSAKNNKPKSVLFKIIPAAAAIALVIGLANILPAVLNNINISGGVPGSDSDRDRPGAYAGAANDPLFIEPEDEINFFLPQYIEKTFFEERILANITDLRDRDRLSAYYTLQDPSDPTKTDEARKELLLVYPFAQTTPVYVFDYYASKREINQITEIFQTHIPGLTGNEIIRMYLDSGIPFTKETAFYYYYAHVRFGWSKDILLLDVEWHTYETYREEIIQPVIISQEEFKQTQQYIDMPDEEKEWRAVNGERWLEFLISRAEDIRNGTEFFARYINGKSTRRTPENPEIQGVSINIANTSEEEAAEFLSRLIDENGYYIFEIYPRHVYISYVGLDDHWTDKYFCCEFDGDGFRLPCEGVNSASEFNIILEEKLRPYADDLLARMLINQDEYDRAVQDPLDYFADMYF
jgi:hypothetical protein